VFGIEAHLDQVKEIGRPLGIGFLGLGIDADLEPCRRADEPKGAIAS